VKRKVRREERTILRNEKHMNKSTLAIGLLALLAIGTVLAYKSIESLSKLNLDSFSFGDEDDQEFDL
jgi:hypothetical protein